MSEEVDKSNPPDGGKTALDIIGGDDDIDTSPTPATIDDNLEAVDTDNEEEDTEETKDTEETEETESSDDSEEVEEPSDSYFRRPTVKEVEAKFPGLFKSFPGLKRDFFLAKQYREVFPTVESAKEAADRAPLFKAFEQDIISGNSKLLLDSIKETGGADSLHSFVDNFLPTLLESDKDSYVRVTKPILVGVLRKCEEIGKQNENKNLQNAAKLIHQVVFGTTEIKDVEVPKEDPNKKQLQTERQKLDTERFQEFHSSVMEDGENTLVAEITRRVDPNKTLSDGIRKYIVTQTFDQIADILSADKEHIGRINALWSQAKSTLSDRKTWQNSKSRIISAYLARARAEIPAIAKKLLSEVVSKNPTQRKETKTIPSGGNSRSTSGKTISVKDAKAGKMSAMDIITAGAKD